MNFFWTRRFFHKRPRRRAAPTPVEPAATASGATSRALPGSNEWRIVMIFGAIAALFFARDILVPLAFAVVLTFILTPLVATLERWRIGRVPSVAVVVLLTIAAVGCVAWVIAIQLVNVARELPSYRPNIHAKMVALRIPTKGPLGMAANSLREIARELSSEEPIPAEVLPPEDTRKPPPQPGSPDLPFSVRISPQPQGGLDYLKDLVQPVLRPLALTGLVIIFTVFMLINRFDLRQRLFGLVGLGQINVLTQALDDAAERVSRFLLMQVLVNISFGAIFGIGLYGIGVPNAALWGVLAALLRIVPYVGAMTAAVLPIGLALAAFPGWLPAWLVVILFATLELFIANFVEPWLYGANTGISSLALLVAAAFWTSLWGAAGLILSTPLTVCVVVVGRYVPQLSFLHVLLRDEVVLRPEAVIYQRLLAMDQHEAFAIVIRALKERSLVELYDSVLVPVLSLTEQDRHKGAIDAGREEYLFLSLNEMINELPEHHTAAATAVRAAPHSGPKVTAGILCLPANDQADEITAAMLAQLLEQAGHPAMCISAAQLSPAELLAVIELAQIDVICISALPPFAFTPARALCKQIRERFPDIQVVVGVWGFGGDAEKAKARFERTQPDRLLTTLAQAVTQIDEMIHARAR
jgi:predicted PurR-regulated permease PerM